MKMLRCSRYLWIFTVFMLGFPVFYLVYVALIFELKSKGVLSVALSPLFYITSILWFFTGIGLQRMKHWSWYTFAAAQLVLAYLNAFNLVTYSESEFKGYVFILSLGIQFMVYRVVEGELRVPFLFPRLRWWESGIAGMHHLSVEIHHSRSPSGSSITQLLDVSNKGCFLKSPIDFEPFEKIKIKLVGYGQEVDVPGQIVWTARSTVTHPKGIGIRFSNLNRKKRRKVKLISKRFEREKAKNEIGIPTPSA
jgi:Tfp pilus assembly protein PilZ